MEDEDFWGPFFVVDLLLSGVAMYCLPFFVQYDVKLRSRSYDNTSAI